MARRAAPRSLADELRSWDGEQLVALLRARPDLIVPAPIDLATVAARSTTRSSIGRALDGLDTFALQVVDALAVQPDGASRAATATLLGLRPADLTAALVQLRRTALVWGPDSALRLVLTVREVLGPYPAGLGPPLPATAAAPTAPDALQALLDQAPDGVRGVLDRLVDGPPIGSVPHADRVVHPDDARSPVEWLLAHRLLTVADADHVVLPREVALHLRGGQVHRDVRPNPPPASGDVLAVDAVSAAAGPAAAEVLVLVEELGELWGAGPPGVLRSGGLGVRDLRRTATALDVDEPVAARVVELAYAAGLIADDGAADLRWAPTPAYDDWVREPAPERWATLAVAWAGSARAPELVGTRDDRGVVRAALSDAIVRPALASVRADVLTELVGLAAGTAPSVDALLDRLRWRRPRRAGAPWYRTTTGWALHGAAWLGVTGRGALSAAGTVLAEHLAGSGAPDSGDAVAAAAAPMLPRPVEHVLLQADLTAVAPGPLRRDLSQLLRLIADIESRGGATVYRFSEASVRRGLDAGWSADLLLDQLTQISRTPVPQALSYLLRDVARRHGMVRVGAAAAYVRSDDPAALQELLADRRAASLRLRMLAPTVLISQADPATTLRVLRDVGLAPGAETADGTVAVSRPDARRTPARRPPHPSAGPPAHSTEVLQDLVQRLRTSVPAKQEAPSGQAPVPPHRSQPRLSTPALPPPDPAVIMARLRDAVAHRSMVRLRFTDATGRAHDTVAEPLVVDGGRITFMDVERHRVREVAVHRIAGVTDHLVDDPGVPATGAIADTAAR
ncbi:MAG: helicase-associated domain-containing protein [Angustibacter sp.]